MIITTFCSREGQMPGSAAVLGIHPPSTVRIDMDGWVQDWPHEAVEFFGDRVEIHGPRATLPCGFVGSAILVHYAYEHARQLEPGTWIFHGREDFTVTAGPPQPASVN